MVVGLLVRRICWKRNTAEFAMSLKDLTGTFISRRPIAMVEAVLQAMMIGSCGWFRRNKSRQEACAPHAGCLRSNHVVTQLYLLCQHSRFTPGNGMKRWKAIVTDNLEMLGTCL